MKPVRAIVATESGPALVERELRPGAGEVAIDVAYAGICRTDLAVADGTIAVAPGRVLGHELAGRIEGAPVTVVPFAACDGCTACAAGERCARPCWLGIDRDGAFAERAIVPARCVLPLPAGMPLALGAYVEPVAAALGVLAVVDRGARVLVAGDNRIAELTARVVTAHGARVAREREGTFDVVVEHGDDPAALLACVRPGGTLVLKSRARRAIALPAGELVARDLTVRGVSHGSFEAAIDWLATRRIVVEDLLAAPRPLAELEAVFAAARASEAKKQMFAIAPELG